MITNTSSKLVNLELSYSCFLQRRGKGRTTLLQLEVVDVKHTIEVEFVLPKGNKPEDKIMKGRVVTHGERFRRLYSTHLAGTMLKKGKQMHVCASE